MQKYAQMTLISAFTATLMIVIRNSITEKDKSLVPHVNLLLFLIASAFFVAFAFYQKEPAKLYSLCVNSPWKLGVAGFALFATSALFYGAMAEDSDRNSTALVAAIAEAYFILLLIYDYARPYVYNAFYPENRISPLAFDKVTMFQFGGLFIVTFGIVLVMFSAQACKAITGYERPDKAEATAVDPVKATLPSGN